MHNCIQNNIDSILFQDRYKTLSDTMEFPLTDNGFYTYMKKQFESSPELIHFFASINKDVYGKPYINVFIWDRKRGHSYKRFIIAEGHRLPEEDEKRFLYYLSKAWNEKSVCLDGINFWRFYKRVRKHLPQLHYRFYPEHRLEEAFNHLYYASFCSCKEILYKAGLDKIAYFLDDIEGYNIIGSTPSKILFNMPLKLLRILNSSYLVTRLLSEAQRELALRTYNKFCSYIWNGEVSCAQWAYLENLTKGYTYLSEIGFKRTLYEGLKDKSEDIVEEYELFLHKMESIGKNGIKKLPKADDIEYAVENLSRVLECYNDEYVEGRIKRISQQTSLLYENEEYVVITPQSSLDFYHEAIGQGNCIVNYLRNHADYDNDTRIVFLRRKNNINEPYVTIQIVDNIIYEALGKNNRLPEVEVYRFLEEYSRNAWLIYDPMKLIKPEIISRRAERERWEELERYLRDYKERNSMPLYEYDTENEDQISLTELYPEIFDQRYNGQ